MSKDVFRDGAYWTLTNELRFVNRRAYEPIPGEAANVAQVRITKVLQQKWVRQTSEPAEKWADVPLNDEEA